MSREYVQDAFVFQQDQRDETICFGKIPVPFSMPANGCFSILGVSSLIMLLLVCMAYFFLCATSKTEKVISRMFSDEVRRRSSDLPIHDSN